MTYSKEAIGCLGNSSVIISLHAACVYQFRGISLIYFFMKSHLFYFFIDMAHRGQPLYIVGDIVPATDREPSSSPIVE